MRLNKLQEETSSYQRGGMGKGRRGKRDKVIEVPLGIMIGIYGVGLGGTGRTV